MPVRRSEDADALAAAQLTRNLDDIAGLDLAVRLGGVAVEIDLAALAGPLRLRSRLEQARDIEPDIEAHRVGDGSVFHRNGQFGDRPRLQPRPVPILP